MSRDADDMERVFDELRALAKSDGGGDQDAWRHDSLVEKLQKREYGLSR